MQEKCRHCSLFYLLISRVNCFARRGANHFERYLKQSKYFSGKVTFMKVICNIGSYTFSKNHL